MESADAGDTGSNTDTGIDSPDTSGGGGEGAPELTQAQAQKAVETLPEEMLDRVYTVTIDGQPQQLTVREMARLRSFEIASQKRMQDAAKLNKKLEEFVTDAKKDPAKALERLGYDPEKFSEEFLRRKIEELKMSPEERRAQQERESFEERKKQFEGQVEVRIREEIDHEMTTAFQKSGLPKSPFLAARLANLVAQSIEKSKADGGEPLSYEAAADKVKVWFKNSTRESLSQMDPSGILDFLGPDLVKKLQQALVSQLKGAAPTSGSTQAPSANAEQAKKSKKPTGPFKHWKDYHNYIESL